MKQAELVPIPMPNQNGTPSARTRNVRCDSLSANGWQKARPKFTWLSFALPLSASIHSTLVPLGSRSPDHLARSYVTSARIAVRNCHLPFGNCRHRRDSDRSRDDAMRDRIFASATQTVYAWRRAIDNYVAQDAPLSTRYLKNLHALRSYISDTIGKIIGSPDFF